jgi:hypothetical protein
LSGKGDDDEGCDLGALDELPDLSHLCEEADVLLHVDSRSILALDLRRVCTAVRE